MSNLKYILIAVIIGALIVFTMYRNSSKKKTQEDADVVIERIEAVKKLIVTEGYFSELYNCKKADKYFYDLI